MNKVEFLDYKYEPGFDATVESSNQVLREDEYLIDPDEQKDQQDEEYLERMYSQRRENEYQF